MITKKKFINYFTSEEMDILVDVVSGNIYLDSEYPTLYKKTYEFYHLQGVQLYGDIDDDYVIIVDELMKDLS
jgi:hypothetical protein